MTSGILETVDRLKDELDQLRPLPPHIVARVEQKLRIESNYHSNAVEGNSLTLGETRSLILHGLTARGKPMRDHLDIQGHDDAVKAIENAVKEEQGLNEVFIRNLHRALLKEPYEVDAIAPDGTPCKRMITIGAYKSIPNNVETSTGEVYYFTPPEQVKPEMTDLLDWYRARESAAEHPVIIAATFHYRFVRIHPFDDGNGRMARLLMNLILIKHGYTVAIVPSDRKTRYLQELERVDQSEDLTQFIQYIASCCTYALELYLHAARGEPIEDPEDIDREIALFKRSVVKSSSAADRIALRQYVDAVACPLYEYFASKVQSIASDISLSTYGPAMELEGMDVDGKMLRAWVYGNVGDPDNFVDREAVPEFATTVTIKFVFQIQRFKNTERMMLYHVDNEIDSGEVVWKLRLEGSQSLALEDYHGQDLLDVKMRIKELLNQSMRIMKRWSD